MITVDLIAGARPNLMKLAPVWRAMKEDGQVQTRIVHTGQHYDRNMNAVFLEELGIPDPDVHLEVGSGSHGAQTACILERYEAHLMEMGAGAAVVFGDVNSTVACALAAAKLGVPVVHVEAGLRSFDRGMPEEINRVLTDRISDLLLVSEPSGVGNLAREGIFGDRVHLVGNVMIDTLMREVEAARAQREWAEYDLEPEGYGLVTLHRPSNVDDPEVLSRILRLLREISCDLPLVFPVHPRTRAAAEKNGFAELLEPVDGLLCLAPQPYRANLGLMVDARVVLTDSGGMQEETTALGVPCITMRFNTERPLTTEVGTSRLVGNDVALIRQAFSDVLEGRWPEPQVVPLWDGLAGRRVAKAISDWLRLRRC